MITKSLIYRWLICLSLLLLTWKQLLAQSTGLPEDAQKLIKKLPNQTLSLDFVLAKAASSSDSFRAIQAQAIAVDANRLQSLAALSTQVMTRFTYGKNESSEASFFDPRQTQTLSLGVAKRLSTGTQVSIEASDLRNQLAPGNTFQLPNKSAAKLTLSQSLWKDSFGYLTRRNIAAGESQTEANRAMVLKSVQDWVYELSKIYYGALLARTQVKTARTNLERRQRLLNITRIKLNRGTAERPDLLQVESAQLSSKMQYEKSKEDLQAIWRELVVSLKLPVSWLEISAELIPLAYDQPFVRAQALCSDPSNRKRSMEYSAEVQLWKSRHEAAKNSLAAAKNAFSPEVNLEGSYGSTGALGDFNNRSKNSLQGNNPEWSIGVKMAMPIEWYQERSEVKRALAQFTETEALYEKAKSDHSNQWINSCSQLQLHLNAKSDQTRATKNLAERAALEEKRFQLGRTSTLAVISSGDDFANAELMLSQTLSALNETAWSILRQNAEIEPILKNIIKTYSAIQLLEGPNDKAH